MKNNDLAESLAAAAKLCKTLAKSERRSGYDDTASVLEHAAEILDAKALTESIARRFAQGR